MNKVLDLFSFSPINKYQQGGSAHTVNDKVILNLKKGLNNYVYSNDNSLIFDNGDVNDIDVNSEFTNNLGQSLSKMRNIAAKMDPARFGRKAWTRGGVSGGGTFTPSANKVYGKDYEIMNFLLENGVIQRAEKPRFSNYFLPSGTDEYHADSNDYEYRQTYDQHELSTNGLDDTSAPYQSHVYQWKRKKGSDDDWTLANSSTDNPVTRTTKHLDSTTY